MTRPDTLPESLAPELATRAACEDEIAAAGKRIDALQRDFAEKLTSEARFVTAHASRMCGISDSTGRRWRDHADVRRYIAALIRLEALKVSVSRVDLIRELAFIAMLDPAELWSALEAAPDGDDDPEASSMPEKEDGRQRPALGFTDIRRLPQRVTRAIKSVKLDKGEVVEITFHDKLKALQTLGEGLGYFNGQPVGDDEERRPWTGFRVLAPVRSPKEE